MALTGELVITIPGAPKPKGSMKCVGQRGPRKHVLVEDNAGSTPWRESVVGWLAKVDGDAAADQGQPLGAEVTFTVPRPTSHYRTRGGQPTGEVKPSAPAHPTSQRTGDVDKLLRLILDALQDGPRPLLPNDAQVCEVTTRKAYPIPGPDPDPYDRLPYPGVRIRLYPL